MKIDTDIIKLTMLFFIKYRKKSLAVTLIQSVIGGAFIQLIGVINSFFLSITLAHYLKPEGLGLYTMVWAAILVLSLLAQLGLSELATREIAITIAQKKFCEAKGILISFPIIVLISSILILAIAFYIIDILNIKNDEAWEQALFALPLMALIGNLTGLLRGLQKVIIAQVFEAILRPMIFLLLIIGLFYFKGKIDVNHAFLILVVTLVIVFAINCYVLYINIHKEIYKVRPTYHFHAWQKSAIPMFISELSRIIFSQYPFIMLGLLVSLNDVGMYRVAYTMAVLQGMPVSVLNLSLTSYMAKLHALNENKKLQRLVSVASTISLMSTITISIIYFFLGEYLIELFFGVEYNDAWPILMLLSLANIIRGFTGSVIPLLNMTGEEKIVRNNLILNLLISFGLSIIFLPIFGAIALPMSIIVSEVITRFLLWSATKKKLHIDASAFTLIRYLCVHKYNKIRGF